MGSHQVFGYTPLEEALKFLDAEGLERTLAEGTDPDAGVRDGGEWLPALLYLAHNMREGCLARAESLLRHGADVDAAGPRGRTAAHEAATSANTELLWLLLRHGAGLEARDADGYTVLHHAIDSVCPSRDVVRALLRLGADPHARRADAGTTLHTAARTGERKVIAELIDAGVDPTLRDRHGRLAHECAAERFEPAAAQQIERYFKASQANSQLRERLPPRDTGAGALEPPSL